MADYADLVELLRKCDGFSVECNCPYYAKQYQSEYTCRELLCRAAADAIEELGKRCETQKNNLHVLTDAYMRCWIPVTERLPNVDTTKSGYEYTTVIVACCGRKKSRPMVYERACVRGKIVYRWKWIRGRIYDGPPVTHWMPLPEPPKEVPTDV